MFGSLSTSMLHRLTLVEPGVLRHVAVGNQAPRHIGMVLAHPKQRVESRYGTRLGYGEARHDFSLADTLCRVRTETRPLFRTPDAILRAELVGASRGAKRQTVVLFSRRERQARRRVEVLLTGQLSNQCLGRLLRWLGGVLFLLPLERTIPLR